MNQACWIVLLLTLFGCSGDTTTTDSEGSDTALDTDTSASGEALYLSYCAACHGEDGTGTAAGTDIVQELHHSDQDLVRIILEGDGDMDPVDVTADQAQHIVDYMREAWE